MTKPSELLRRNLVRVREAQRITYVELSRRLEEADQPIAVLGLRRIEKGERRVDVDELSALAKALRITTDALLWDGAGCTSCDGMPPTGFTCNECGAGR